ncbi:MAG TPA: accessory factor UbiK family protein [Burkholderiales bacterium]|nr:accessory factor UbiK family protein [Burkholderiales bacterium]
MLNPSFLEELTSRVSALISTTPAGDLQRNLHSLLSGFLGRLDLVTREEFDIQSAVLHRTREKLEQLEAKVAELERAQSPPTV